MTPSIPTCALAIAMLVCGPGCAASVPASQLATAPVAPSAIRPLPESLGFDDLLAPAAELAPSDKAQHLAERRVRMVGFMAELELALPGAFYLTPRPLRSDEAGGGTADLPPNSVLVLLSETERDVPFIPGPLEVIGKLEVGNHADQRGRVSAFRIQLDDDRLPQTGSQEKRP